MPSPDAGESKGPAAVFPLNGESKLVWLSGHHREVLKTLDAAIEQGRGLLLLTGDIGSGKSTLTRALVDGLIGTTVRVSRLPFPDLTPTDFYTFLAEEFAGPATTGQDFLAGFPGFLRERLTQGERVLLVIDDAQTLRPELFGELARLLEMDQEVTEQRGVFNVLLVGPSHLETILEQPEHATLVRLIQVRCALRPFTAQQVAGYVRYHLGAAGLESSWFTPAALDEIYARSGGSPRMINLVCDQALQLAMIAGMTTVDAALVRQCGVEDETAKPVGAREGLPEPTEDFDDDFEEVVERETAGRRSLVRVGGLAVLGLALVLGGLGYLGLRSTSRAATPPDAGKVVELPPRTTDAVAPGPTLPAIPPPEMAARRPLPPPAPAAIDATQPVAAAPEKPRPEPVTAPPPARERPVGAKRSPVAASEAVSASPPAVTPRPTVRAPAVSPGPATDDQDPGAIIDWLLKQPR